MESEIAAAETSRSAHAGLSELESIEGRLVRQRGDTWVRLRRNPGAMIGLALVITLLLLAAGADLIASQGIDEQSLRDALLPPGDQYTLGTDEFGRDMLSRIIHGARVSLQVAIITAMISMAVGVSLGLIAGYFGGPIDYVIQALLDISWAFPTVLMAIFLVAVLGPGLVNVMVAVGLVYWGGFARVVRGQVLSLREWEYVNAARAIGASDLRIIIRHVVPNIIAPVIVMTTLMMGDAILIEATLSFVGMGAQPPIPSWGSILSGGRTYLVIAPWVTLFPGIAIMLVVLGFNLLGDGLRDALDPRLR
ncbi:MAG: ABC transporter permease [Chloroflexi bacterium]|nr:ABC transporter permease [Chloroflexota bacterium]